ncbi:unnamed protein product [Arabidopsis thaliana]|uniref:Uncharacterized protein n=2 Tax=Arabidopsis thaliana TaxID=3702 RepID=A0A654FWR9_ARATH|nr:uncharacterized protein AT4G38781 [Arabidopsis thaliana]AEE86974.1 hypothetical protein AT4G38781 [Arabidopsis thaliana]CAA0397940.1 unnamed protein product [Arabidopsis thaliana]VYS65332.1 unnamed protein product [Arabidopsis thaliana]|eukprot:NP_001119141.1 hypothetical protein AT4G38781 [Arabidopsis thaliana]
MPSYIYVRSVNRLSYQPHPTTVILGIFVFVKARTEVLGFCSSAILLGLWI